MENTTAEDGNEEYEMNSVDQEEMLKRQAEENARLLEEDRQRKEARKKSRKQVRADRDVRGMEETPHGSFTFRAESIKLILKEDIKIERVAIAFGLLSPGENTPSWWGAQKPVAASLDNKGNVNFDNICLGTTKQFKLTEEFLSPLLAMKITITVYEMRKESPDVSSDPILGSSNIELSKLLVEDHPELELTLKLVRPNNHSGNLLDDESSTAIIKLTCDDALAEYVLGSCVLNCGPIIFENPPLSWTLEGADSGSSGTGGDEHNSGGNDGGKGGSKDNSTSGGNEGEETSGHTRSPAVIKSMMADGKLNQTFSLSLAQNPLIPALKFKLGTMTYEPPPPSELKSRIKSSSSSPDGIPDDSSLSNLPAESGRGSWRLTFKSTAKYFIKRENLAKLHKAVSEGECIEVHLTRNKVRGTPTLLQQHQQAEDGVEEVFKPEEPWIMLVTSDISQLLTADVTKCYAQNRIVQAPVNMFKPTTGISKSKAKQLYATRMKEVAAVLDAEEESNRFKCEVPVILSRSFKQATIEVECQQLTADDVVPPRRVHPKKPPRKFEDELRGELVEMVRNVCEEYEVLFSGAAKVNKRLSVKEQGAQLLEVLTTAGVRHDFMERLKPVVQRAVMSRFGRAPYDEAEKDRYLSELYSWLMSCVSQMLVKIYAPMVAEEQEEIKRHRLERGNSMVTSGSVGNFLIRTVTSGDHSKLVNESQEMSVVLEQLEDLRVCSIDLEAMDEWKSAMIRNEDRVTEAVHFLVNNPESTDISSEVWHEFGKFQLRAAINEGPLSPKFNAYIGKAVEALHESSKLNPNNAEVSKLLGSILLEQGRYEEAGEVLKDALDLESPCVGYRRTSSSSDVPTAPRTPAQMAEPEPLTSTLNCLYYNAVGNYAKAGEYLNHAVRSFNNKGLTAPGKPRRTASLLALEAADFLVEAALPGLAQLAMDLATKAEAASIAKAAGVMKTKPTKGNTATRIAAAKMAAVEAAEKVKEAGGEGSEPASIIQQRLRVSAKIALLKRDLDTALPLAEAATVNDPDDSEAWKLLGDVNFAAGSNQREASASAYSKAVSILDQSTPPIAPPLKLLVRLGSLHLHLGRFEEAKQTYLMGAGSWQTCSMWLGVGVALLRLENFGDAECAFQEANLRNNRSAAVWGYMCLLCLNTGASRLTQADHARNVAERLGLSDPILLRELGNAYTSLDRLETAEGLFRRSLAVDENNSHTRRRLADALSAQNAVADAVNEYFRVIENFKEKMNSSPSISNEGENKNDAEDRKECLLAIGECEHLLKTLGRMEEFAPLKALRLELKNSL
jgi:tetratricopeptide (TPR) repeat protein